jgi:beta-galactosidase
MRQGHPDQAAFHHDLYRGVGRGRWQVMEQQPGPVNWAPYNPAPLPGMVRLWTWEAFAHGAEVVSYFRWRQAPFAQEQMHAGLLRPDSVEDAAAREARQVFSELALAHGASTQRAPVALLFSYEAQWMLDIQRQGASFDYTQLCFEWYSAFRRLGLDVDILDPRQDLTGYALIAAPSLPIVRGDLRDRLLNSNAALLIGPRSGSKTEQYRIAEGLPPGALRGLLPITISRVESLRPNHTEQVNGEGAVTRWFEHVDGDAEVVERTAAGAPVWLQHECATYVAGWPDETLLRRICESVCARAGIETVWLPEALRLRTLGDLHFAFNYGSEPVSLDSVGATEGMNFVIGGPTLPPAGVAAWRRMAR